MWTQSQSLADIARSIFSWRPNQIDNSIPDKMFFQQTYKSFEFYRTAWLFYQKTIILLKKSSRAAAHIFQAHSSRWNIEQP